MQVFPKMDGNPAKVAVENMSAAVASGECFGCERTCLALQRVC